MSERRTVTLDLPNQPASERLADALAHAAEPGLVVLLDGPVGAGKTTIARRVIQSCLARHDLIEDVPSPTFTIVQTYHAGSLEIWHADLYRLTTPSELEELGLTVAFDEAFCLVEWPDRMGRERPDALEVILSYGPYEDARQATITGSDRHADVIDALATAAAS